MSEQRTSDQCLPPCYEAWGRDELEAEIHRLTRERDEWARKWHSIRAELAELKYPGMKGIILAKNIP